VSAQIRGGQATDETERLNLPELHVMEFILLLLVSCQPRFEEVKRQTRLSAWTYQNCMSCRSHFAAFSLVSAQIRGGQATDETERLNLPKLHVM